VYAISTSWPDNRSRAASESAASWLSSITSTRCMPETLFAAICCVSRTSPHVVRRLPTNPRGRIPRLKARACRKLSVYRLGDADEPHLGPAFRARDERRDTHGLRPRQCDARAGRHLGEPAAVVRRRTAAVTATAATSAAATTSASVA